MTKRTILYLTFALALLARAAAPARAATEAWEPVGGAAFSTTDADDSDGIDVVATVPNGTIAPVSKNHVMAPYARGKNPGPSHVVLLFKRQGDKLLVGAGDTIGSIGKDGAVAFAPGRKLVLVRVIVTPTLYEKLRYGAKGGEYFLFELKGSRQAADERARKEAERRQKMIDFGTSLPKLISPSF